MRNDKKTELILTTTITLAKAAYDLWRYYKMQEKKSWEQVVTEKSGRKGYI